jgi:hypothetical protein
MVSVRENMDWWCGAGKRSVLDIGGIVFQRVTEIPGKKLAPVSLF